MGMSEEMTIRVNFSRPMPIFPLSGVVLLPQQVLPLHIFEERYRQMTRIALDSAGQIAMAVMKPGAESDDPTLPPIMPAVCVGQIEQHESRPDGTYNVLLRGVCRAKVLEEFRPDGERLYREAMLQPLGVESTPGEPAERLRSWIEDVLGDGPLSHLTVAEHVRELVANDEMPTGAVLELVSFAVLSDASIRYRLLSEGDADTRASILRGGLEDLGEMIERALLQRPDEWPKGCSWN
ncbi:MAG: hypothetical protein CMJ31_03480 [Phycisphaerae bacterium]|nr:hypothetical protein [Phycisphaerae bacterium]